MDMKASEFLSEAREHVAEGWTQGMFQDFRGVCASGAMMVVDRYHGGDTYEVYSEACDAMGLQIIEQYPVGRWICPTSWRGPGHVSIPSWNDDDERTQQQVLDIFDKTILGLQEAGN
jgi:hypothetical protein